MVLGELRAAAATHGPLALVHLDAHADVWEQYYGVRYFHGTVFKRAVEAGAQPAGGVGPFLSRPYWNPHAVTAVFDHCTSCSRIA